MSRQVTLDELCALRNAATAAMKDSVIGFNNMTGCTVLSVDGVEVAHHDAEAERFESAKDARIAKAARALVSALDRALPDWRQETLQQQRDGDEVNAAWDELVGAIDGKPKNSA